MQLTVLGANRQVTGSRYCLEAGGRRIMIDCGMFQEREFLARNWESCPVSAQDFDALLLTHVHVDHSGLLPKLVRDGFVGPIYTTRPSVELAAVVLRDAAHIQMEDALFKQKRHRKEGRSGRFPVVPLYTEADVERVLPRLKPVPYRKPIAVNDVFSVTFHDAGHILGSAMLEVRVTEGATTHSVLFSGDIGQWNRPIVRDPTLFERADFVVMESTYGDRDHDGGEDIGDQLRTVINSTVSRGGSVIVPTFAIERAQELMYYISRLAYAGSIPHVEVFLDSPMAANVTDIFLKFRDCYDEETWQLINSGQSPLRFPGLRLVRTVKESQAINSLKMPCIIMASAGMCNAGRIKHHLRHHIGNPHDTILFVGYQARGTLGRQILDGAEEVRIHGNMQRVRARIEQIHGLSAHADRRGLLRWLGHLQEAPRRVFVTHGEEDSSLAFARQINEQLKWPVHVPQYAESVPL
jgi:metallo-beta-lactamase family protein